MPNGLFFEFTAVSVLGEEHGIFLLQKEGCTV
jgi:hypothetical protein